MNSNKYEKVTAMNRDTQTIPSMGAETHRQLNYSKAVKWDYIFGDALKWRCPSVRPN
jgi:hypothetical protein